MPQETQLRIASHIVSALVCQNRARPWAERLEDIQEALNVSAELMRRFHGSTPPRASAAPRPKTMEAVIRRGVVPSLDEWRAKRSAQGATAPNPANRSAPAPRSH